MTLRLGWFATGRGEGSRKLLSTICENIRDGTIDGRIEFVFMNREEGEAEGSDRFISLVREYGLTLITFSSSRYQPEMRRVGRKDPAVLKQWRIEFDREAMKRVGNLSPDLCVLGGYMLVVGEEMCRKLDMINLHPAAPDGPTGTWQEVIWKLIDTGATESGVMIHLVTAELDKGPPISYCTFPIRGGSFDPLWSELEVKLKSVPLEEIARKEGVDNRLFREIRREGVIREQPLVGYTTKAFADATITLRERKIFAGETPLTHPYCLNEEIERFLKDSKR